MVRSLSEQDYQVNIGVLETAHSIFRPWRAATRTDALFTTINYVLSRFVTPFLQLFSHTANISFSSPSPPNLALVAQTQAILVDLFYDLTCQDLPPAMEDSHAQFFGPDGLFLKFLNWSPAELAGEVHIRHQIDEFADLRAAGRYNTIYTFSDQNRDPRNRRSNVTIPKLIIFLLTLPQLYLKIYPEVLQSSSSVEAFVGAIWQLLGGGKLSGVADDQVCIVLSSEYRLILIICSSSRKLFGSSLRPSELDTINNCSPRKPRYQLLLKG